MTISTDHRSRKTAERLETEITAGLERIRTRVAGETGAESLLSHLDALDRRLVELRRRLDDMPDVGGAWGMASDTPLAGLADVVLRVERLEEVLGEDLAAGSMIAAERVAAEPLPRPVRLLSRQHAVLERVRGGIADPRLSGWEGQ